MQTYYVLGMDVQSLDATAEVLSVEGDNQFAWVLRNRLVEADVTRAISATIVADKAAVRRFLRFLRCGLPMLSDCALSVSVHLRL